MMLSSKFDRMFYTYHRDIINLLVQSEYKEHIIFREKTVHMYPYKRYNPDDPIELEVINEIAKIEKPIYEYISYLMNTTYPYIEHDNDLWTFFIDLAKNKELVKSYLERIVGRLKETKK